MQCNPSCKLIVCNTDHFGRIKGRKWPSTGPIVHSILASITRDKKAAKNVSKTKFALVKELAKCTKDLLDCLNVPKHALYAPIAADYVKYNAQPNFGEVIGAKM